MDPRLTHKRQKTNLPLEGRAKRQGAKETGRHMMRFVKMMLAMAVIALAASCTQGPQVTHVLVEKEARKMHLLRGARVVKTYDMGLGFSPEGHKQFEGDGRTPEGRYVINRRNPNSQFHLSLGISYPNAADRAYARARGKSPGGDIFIHGRPWKYRKGGRDWTAGCIAVTNREIEEIYRLVPNGTPITIRP